MELSRKDAHLLFELDQDSRQSYLGLARKLRASKNTVAQRIVGLRKQGTIAGFYPVIDVGKMGLRGIRAYVKLRNCPPSKRQEIVRHLVQSPLTWWVGEIDGEFDIGLVAWVKGIPEFEGFWRKTEEKFKAYLGKVVVCLYTGVHEATSGFLFPEKRRAVYRVGEIGNEKLSANELAVLRELSLDARARTVAIASRLGVSPLTVKGCIRRLQNCGVIRGFRVRLDLASLGYTYYKIDLLLRNREARKSMLPQVLSDPRVVFIDESIGWADLEVGAVFRSHIEFREFLENVLGRNSKSITGHSYFIYLNVWKARYL